MDRCGASISAILGIALICGCSDRPEPPDPVNEVPREDVWGIYDLDLAAGTVGLIYSSSNEIGGINLDNSGTTLAFSMKSGTDIIDTTSEIYAIGTDGMNLRRLTDNDYYDAYPSFSSDDSNIVFISKRNGTLALYVMNADGSEQQELYDSGGHDADVNWGNGELIVFTRNHQIWILHSDGTNPQQITDPPNAGQWGSANLPIGDYDPRLSPDDSLVVFERLEDPDMPNGGYNLFVINIEGTDETRLTNNYYTQGLPGWSHLGDRIVYIVSAIDNVGKFDIYMINADGTNNHNITPDYFPDLFLARQAIFSRDDSKIFFIGEWWQ